MTKEKLLGYFKSMRIISLVLGLVLIVLGILKMFFVKEGTTGGGDTLAFGLYSIIGITIASFGYVIFSKFMVEYEECISKEKAHDEGF